MNSKAMSPKSVKAALAPSFSHMQPCEMRHVRLLPEWLGQTGLWLKDPRDGIFDAVSAEDIGLSELLADRLEDWMDEFDSILNEEDPSHSVFPSFDSYARWRQEGEALADALRAELSPQDVFELRLPEHVVP